MILAFSTAKLGEDCAAGQWPVWRRARHWDYNCKQWLLILLMRSPKKHWNFKLRDLFGKDIQREGWISGFKCRTCDHFEGSKCYSRWTCASIAFPGLMFFPAVSFQERIGLDKYNYIREAAHGVLLRGDHWCSMLVACWANLLGWKMLDLWGSWRWSYEDEKLWDIDIWDISDHLCNIDPNRVSKAWLMVSWLLLMQVVDHMLPAFLKSLPWQLLLIGVDVQDAVGKGPLKLWSKHSWF